MQRLPVCLFWSHRSFAVVSCIYESFFRRDFTVQEFAGIGWFFSFVNDLHELGVWLCEEAFVLFVRSKEFAGTNRVSSSFVYE